MMSSTRLFSQSRLEHWRPRRSDYIIHVRLETAFSQPNLQTQTDRALRDAAKITQRAVQFRKLCIDVEWLTLGEEEVGGDGGGGCGAGGRRSCLLPLSISPYIDIKKRSQQKCSFGLEKNVSESWLYVI